MIILQFFLFNIHFMLILIDYGVIIDMMERLGAIGIWGFEFVNNVQKKLPVNTILLKVPFKITISIK